MSRFARVGRIPDDFDVIEPTLIALDEELKRKNSENVQGRARAERHWTVHQIDWQRTRYVHDMHFKHEQISKDCYDYCVRNKMINGALSQKWLEQGYERLCSLHAIDSRNFNFGGSCICRVPRAKLREDQRGVASLFNGCLGCGSGAAGVENIFGNRYGQRLAAIQLKRQEMEEVRRLQQEQEQAERVAKEKEEKEAKRKRKEEKKLRKSMKINKQAQEAPWAQNDVEMQLALAPEQEENHQTPEKEDGDHAKRSRVIDDTGSDDIQRADEQTSVH